VVGMRILLAEIDIRFVRPHELNITSVQGITYLLARLMACKMPGVRIELTRRFPALGF